VFLELSNECVNSNAGICFSFYLVSERLRWSFFLMLIPSCHPFPPFVMLCFHEMSLIFVRSQAHIHFGRIEFFLFFSPCLFLRFFSSRWRELFWDSSPPLSRVRIQIQLLCVRRSAPSGISFRNGTVGLYWFCAFHLSFYPRPTPGARGLL